MHSDKIPFAEHVQEIRSRLVWTVIVLIIGSVGGYFLREPIFYFLIHPLNQTLYYTSPTGGLNLVIYTSLAFGFLWAIPIFIYHVLRFLEPIMPVKLRDSITITLFFSCILMICGVLFAYYFSLPAALHFLGGFESAQVQALISTNDYFSFVMIYLIGFAVVFQLPLILLFLNKITPLRPTTLLSYLKHVVLISFIAAAIITPTPDPMNQSMMALPIIILYLISVTAIWIANRKIDYTKTPSRPLRLMDIKRAS